MGLVPFRPLTIEEWQKFHGKSEAMLLTWDRILAERGRIGASLEDLDAPFNEALFDVRNVLLPTEIPMANPDEVPPGYVRVKMHRGVPEGNFRIKAMGLHQDMVKRHQDGFEKKGIPPAPFVGVGNAGEGEIDGVGEGCPDWMQPGKRAIYFCDGVQNRSGHTIKVAGYDAPNIMETTARHILVPWHVLLESPGGEFDAELALRLPTAAHQFELCWSGLEAKEKLGAGRFPDPDHTYRVLVGSGGVAVAFAQYAKLRLQEMEIKHEVWCLSGSPEEHALLESKGVQCLNRHDRMFKFTGDDVDKGLCSEEQVGQYGPAKVVAYLMKVTGKEGFDMVSENVGGDGWTEIVTGTLASMGVLAISGWLLGQIMHLNRAAFTLGQRSIVFPHYCPRQLGETLAPYFRRVSALRQGNLIPWGDIPDSLNRFIRNEMEGLEVWNLAD